MSAATVADPGHWDEEVDLLIIGSGGGGMCAALVAKDLNKTPLMLEKEDKVGGSTSMSGGILWIPGNALLAKAGVKDSVEEGAVYLEALLREPVASHPRRRAFLNTAPRMLEWLQGKGIGFVYCDGWSDYYDELPGGQPRGRSVGPVLFDVRRLGEWKDRLRRGPLPYPTQGNEGQRLTLAKRTLDGFLLAGRIGWRMFMVRLFGRELAGNGAALQGWMLQAVLRADVDLRPQTPVIDLIEHGGRVEGVVARANGRDVRVRARDGVLIAAGGFARNEDMRRQYGPSPASVAWTNANPGDTGEMMRAAMRLGATVDHMDQAIWVPTSLLPNGKRPIHVSEFGKPHLIVVDQQGRRFTDEAGDYMETGWNMYRRGSVPCFAVMDSVYRDRYIWEKSPPGITPSEWISSGYMKKADSLDGLALQCGINAAGLKTTVERFNGFAREGADQDFGRGGRQYDRYRGDPTHKPNPTLGTIEKPPFYAVEIYPGDVGTYGGLVTDAHGRVLREDGTTIPGLYATGNSTASITGGRYPGAGASIAATFVFGYRAAHHACGAAVD